MNAISNVILVHGAWADGSSRAKVIPPLVERRLAVTSVQLPLSSLETDVAVVRHAIVLAQGEFVLEGRLS